MSEPVKRVCLLGAESTGKTTLSRSLAEAYETLWNPEYGRPYTEIGRPSGEPWTSWEFTHIARVQCWYEDYDAYLVCGLDVPFSHDGIREFEEQRRAMHERYLERARRSGSPWALVEGPVSERVAAARALVDSLS
jgi:HTH-type transcriptional regulator, transcriptional repressor of NAD biosynthesis genes